MSTNCGHGCRMGQKKIMKLVCPTITSMTPEQPMWDNISANIFILHEKQQSKTQHFNCCLAYTVREHNRCVFSAWFSRSWTLLSLLAGGCLLDVLTVNHAYKHADRHLNHKMQTGCSGTRKRNYRGRYFLRTKLVSNSRHWFFLAHRFEYLNN